MSFASSVALVDGVVQSLDGVFQNSERTFASICSGLGDAITDFAKLTTTFETLSSSLESDDMRDAAARLTKIAQAISATSAALDGERGALANLLAVNRDIAAGLNRLQSGARTMMILTLNAKIEAARVDRNGEDISIFSIEMASTVKAAQDTVEQHGATQAGLVVLLASACAEQAQFEAKHREKIASISRELLSAFQVVDERRRQAAAIAMGIGRRSTQISAAIGSAIVALQIGDNTRQRVEHVVSALTILRQAFPTNAGELSDENEAEAQLVLLIEAAQIVAASDGFDEGVGQIRDALAQLEKDCAGIGDEGQRICGAGNGAAGSIFDVLTEKLAASKRLMRECAAASASVETAKRSALETLVSLEERMTSLIEAVKQMTLVGVNAALKSRHFGSDGLGLGVIAEQLRSYSRQISADAETLLPALSHAIALAHGLQDQRANLIGMDEFEGELAKAHDSFNAIALDLDRAFASLLADVDKVEDFLGVSIRDLASQEELCATLHDAGQDLDRAAQLIPARAPHSATVLDSLWPLYTMDGERVVHQEFHEPQAIGARANSDAAEMDVDDLLFA